MLLAIAALHDIAEDAAKGPVIASLGLRALLALVYEASHATPGRDRRPFDAFWKAVTDPGREGQDEATRNYVRSHAALAHVAAISRTLGMRPESEEFQRVIDGVRRKQRMAVDADYRARILVCERLRMSKYIPRNLTLAEWEAYERRGWHERTRR